MNALLRHMTDGKIDLDHIPDPPPREGGLLKFALVLLAGVAIFVLGVIGSLKDRYHDQERMLLDGKSTMNSLSVRLAQADQERAEASSRETQAIQTVTAAKEAQTRAEQEFAQTQDQIAKERNEGISKRQELIDEIRRAQIANSAARSSPRAPFPAPRQNPAPVDHGVAPSIGPSVNSDSPIPSQPPVQNPNQIPPTGRISENDVTNFIKGHLVRMTNNNLDLQLEEYSNDVDFSSYGPHASWLNITADRSKWINNWPKRNIAIDKVTIQVQREASGLWSARVDWPWTFWSPRHIASQGVSHDLWKIAETPSGLKIVYEHSAKDVPKLRR